MNSNSSDQIKSCKVSTVPCSIGAILETALEGIHEHVQCLTSKVAPIQKPLKAAARVETEEQNGEEYEHQQNSDGQNSIGQVLL